MPLLLTRPMRPAPAIVAGMMPAFDLPGLAIPGQFGPMIRVLLPLLVAYAQAAVLSCTGMPSVITTASPMLASIASIIGLIALLGIAARNGIMLVSHIEYLRHEEGVTGLREAVVRGSIDRVVPILMTALCTGLALVPVALGAGEPGSEIQAPMATVIIFGLVSSTALNMLVVPAAYYAAHARSRESVPEEAGD